MANLPFDIITNILTRLPAKPLGQFKSVCKPWCALINEPEFIKTHLNHVNKANNNLNIILRDCYLDSIENNNDELKTVDYPYKTSNGGVDVLGSCNGLVCISTLEDVFVIWNITTKEYKKVPETPIEFPGGWGICRTILYGLGYDHNIDDYKLLRIVNFYGDGDDFESEVKVYTLGTNAWKRVEDVRYHILYKRVIGVLVSGALHWVATRKPESDLSKVVVAFDLVDEVFKEVPQPDYEDDEFHMNVGVLVGCLCVLSNFYKVRFDVWVMMDYGVKDSWTKLFTISQTSVIGSFDFVRPLCYWRSGEIVLEKDSKELILYDVKSGNAKNLVACGLPGHFETETYLGSLVSLNTGTYVWQIQAKGKGKQKKKKKNSGRGSRGLLAMRDVGSFLIQGCT